MITSQLGHVEENLGNKVKAINTHCFWSPVQYFAYIYTGELLHVLFIVFIFSKSIFNLG